MILLDTSVVIEFLRTGDARLSALFVTHDAAVCGVTRAEVMHGARSAAHRTQLVAALNGFRQVSLPDDLWDAVGDNLTELRRNGVTVPFQDTVIATVAISNGVELWTRDAQFQHVRRVLPVLRLFVEPP